MIDKFLIIVDERDQKEEVRKIAIGLEKYGFKLYSEQINLSKTKHHSYDKGGNPYVDREKIKLALEEIDFFRRADTIAVDYNLINEIEGMKAEITGFDVISDILRLGYSPNKEIVLYSSGIESAFKDILEKGDFEEKTRKLKILVQGKVLFQKRGYAERIIGILRRDPNTLDGIFAQKMRAYPNFKTDFFEGIQILDLEQLLSQSDGKALKFKKEMVEQFIAHLIKYQDEEE